MSAAIRVRVPEAEAKRRYPNHPSVIHVREDRLWEGTLEWLAQSVFGSDRREKFEDKFSASEKKHDRERTARIKRLRRAIDKLETSQTRLIRALEKDDDPKGVIFINIRQRLAEIEDKPRSKQGELRNLEAEAQERPAENLGIPP